MENEALPTSELILQPFCCFTYVTAHSPNFPSLHLRPNSFSNPSVVYLHHSSFSYPSIVSPTSQFILQPFFRFSYVTSSSLNSPGEPPMCPLVCVSENFGFSLTISKPSNQSIHQSIINHRVVPKGRCFTVNSAFSTLSSSQPSLSYLHTVHIGLLSSCPSSDIVFCRELSSRLPFLLEHPSAGISFLVSGPANLFSSSLSVPALFFLLLLFPA